MLSFKTIPTRVAGRAAMAAGGAYAASGVVQLVHSQRDSGTHVVGLAGHLVLGFFAAGILLMGPSLLALAHAADSRRARQAAGAAVAGTTALGITCITSLVHGQDYSFFNVVAPLTNAAWLLGAIVLAVCLYRARDIRRSVAIALPFTWAALIPLSTLGGGVLAGAYFIAVGCLLADEAVQRPLAAPRAALDLARR